MEKFVLFFFLCSSIVASAQGSITWNMGMNLATSDHGNMHPRITLDGAGNPLVIWGRMSDESVFFSRWNGTTFIAPVKLNPSWLKIATASWMGPDIASKGDTVYVVVKQTPEADTSSHIYIMSSFDAGVTFSSPIRVDYIADSISRFPTVSIDPMGNPIVAFMKFNAKFQKSRWVVTKSADYGKNFSTDVKASGYSGTDAEVCDCCPGAIITSSAVSAMVYRDNLSNIRDIWTGISTTNASSFKSGFGVDKTKWNINSCPASGPDGVIIGDSLYSVFMSGASGNLRTYISKSSISSGTVGMLSNLTGNIIGLSQQNYPRMANYGYAMAIVWKQTVNGSSQLPILFTNNTMQGLPASYDMVVRNDNSNADVAISSDKVFVVWEDDNSGTIKYRIGTYTSTTNTVSEIEQHNFYVYPSPISDFLSIQLVTEKNTTLLVTDILGQKIITQVILPSETNIRINTSDWSNGIYFLTIHNNKTIETQTITVVHK
jgi:hypothetical protein